MERAAGEFRGGVGEIEMRSEEAGISIGKLRSNRSEGSRSEESVGDSHGGLLRGSDQAKPAGGTFKFRSFWSISNPQ